MSPRVEVARPGGGAAGWPATLVALTAVIAVLLGMWALRLSQPVTLPLAFAFVLTLLVHPVQSAIEARLPARAGWLATVAAMLAIVVLLAALAAAFALSVALLAARAPDYLDQLQGSWGGLLEWLRARGLPTPQLDGEQGGQLFGRVTGYLTGILSSLWTIVGFMVLVFFFVLLMLLEARLWRQKAERALAEGRAAALLDTVEVIAGKIRQYLMVRTVMSVVSGLAATVWLWLVGVDFAAVWGLLFFALNYIPNIGSIIAAVPPTLLAFVQFGPLWALAAAGGLVAIEQVIGNYLDPRLQGRTLDVSPLVVLVSVLLWGWIWGPVGALLAVPMTASIMIACAHVPALRPLALMLGHRGDPDALARQTRH